MSISMGQLASRFYVAASKVHPVSDQKLRTVVQVGIGYVKSAIQDVHAVDTGTMLNSTQAQRIGSDAFAIGPTVGYAPYVALGTSRMAARPFHIMAARKLSADIKDLFNAKDFGL